MQYYIWSYWHKNLLALSVPDAATAALSSLPSWSRAGIMNMNMDRVTKNVTEKEERGF